ncbi:MAG: hypothetical protein ACIAXF_09830 [Phycisphaerales bacterium JB063]
MTTTAPPTPTPDHAADASTPTQDVTTDDGTDKLVPVTEAIRYRRRAQQAEQRLTDLERELGELRSAYDASQETITALERRERIDALLTQADTVDLETARLLTEVTVAGMDEPDVAAAIADLRRHKPYLFASGGVGLPSAMGPRDPEQTSDPVVEAETQARETGDRRDLLRYLRLRRNA